MKTSLTRFMDTKPDVWKLATRQEKIAAMLSLTGLPSRKSISPEVEVESYMVALEKVTRYSLIKASKSILQGALGHAFLPSPAELRLQCDKAMAPFNEQREREHRKKRARENFDSYQGLKQPTSESRARVNKILTEFKAGITQDKLSDIKKSK